MVKKESINMVLAQGNEAALKVMNCYVLFCFNIYTLATHSSTEI